MIKICLLFFDWLWCTQGTRWMVFCCFSNHLLHTEFPLAMGTSMLLLVALLDTEWDKTAPHPTSDNAYDNAQDPSKAAFALSDFCHAAAPTEVTVDNDWVLRPLVLLVGLLTLSSSDPRKGLHHDHHLLRLLSSWDALLMKTRECLTWDGLLTWNWLNHDHLRLLLRLARVFRRHLHLVHHSGGLLCLL